MNCLSIEFLSETTRCRDDQFSCKEGWCIDYWRRCNEREDCMLSTDELYCGKYGGVIFIAFRLIGTLSQWLLVQLLLCFFNVPLVLFLYDPFCTLLPIRRDKPLVLHATGPIGLCPIVSLSNSSYVHLFFVTLVLHPESFRLPTSNLFQYFLSGLTSHWSNKQEVLHLIVHTSHGSNVRPVYNPPLFVLHHIQTILSISHTSPIYFF